MRLVLARFMFGWSLFAVGCGSSSASEDEGTGGEANGSGGAAVGGAGSGGVSGAGGGVDGEGGGPPGMGGRSGDTGGAGHVGAGGSGGAPVPGNPPDPELLARCLAVCDRQDRLACSNRDDAECRADCDEMARYPGCEQQLTAMLECMETAPAECDARGNVQVQGCVRPLVEVLYCHRGLTLEPAWVAECESYCEGLRTPSCGAEYPEDECVGGCLAVPVIEPACSASYASLTSCSIDAGFVCDDVLAVAVPDGCEAESSSFTDCMSDREP